jgi:CheY-like chemotaxis protein/anti-sigma regulatory factor (Ser/Thr protein kinase)
LKRQKCNGLLLAQLIDDILDLSKIEAGRLQIEKTEVDLPQLIEDVEAVMRHKASEKAIHFAMNAVDPLPESAKTDPMRLKQILTNIIGNAVKFTNHGKVEVKIYIDQTDCKLRVFVSDTGIGITQEQKNRLFKPFAQADPLITRQFGGTGLGLLLSRHLAQALGGDVRLASSWPSQGSTFEVTVGLEETQYKVRPLETLKVSKGIGNSLSGLRILLAEDIPDNQLLVKRILKNAGAAVEIAADGVEAIEKASRHTYDVILMDIGMPRLDGCEATEELRRRGYKAPIIAVTAYAMKEEVDRFLASGCNGHLAKPIAMETLVQVIRRAVCA